MKKKKDKPQALRTTVNGLADQTGMDQRTVKRMLVNAGLFPPDGRPMDKLLDALKPKVGGDSSLKEKKLFEEWRKLKIVNDAKEGRTVPRVLVAETFAKIGAAIVPMLEQKLQNEYPALVAGLDAPQIRTRGKQLGDAILVEFQRQAEQWGKA